MSVQRLADDLDATRQNISRHLALLHEYAASSRGVKWDGRSSMAQHRSRPTGRWRSRRPLDGRMLAALRGRDGGGPGGVTVHQLAIASSGSSHG